MPADPRVGRGDRRRDRSGRSDASSGARLAETNRAGGGAVDASTGRPPGPQRTCIGCRVRERDVELVRVVVVAGAVVPDPRRRLPGRGAWLHPDLGCYDRAQQRRAFDRALRAGPGLDTTSVRAYLMSGPSGEPPEGSDSLIGDERAPAQHTPAPHAQGIEVDPSEHAVKLPQ